MANSLVQFGAQSATFVVPADGDEANGTLTVTDWAGLPKGKLKDLLNKVYLTTGESPAPDFAAFFADSAAAGILSVAFQNIVDDGADYSKNTTMYWSLDEAGYPMAEFATAGESPTSAGECQVRICVSYSASE